MIVLVGRLSWKGHSFVTMKTSLHVHSALLGDGALGQYDSFSGKLILKRPFITDTGEALALQIHCLGLLGDNLESIQKF